MLPDSQSVVEGVVSFWFFADGESGESPPSIYVSDGGDITDSLGTSYVVESEFLPASTGRRSSNHIYQHDNINHDFYHFYAD